MPILKVATVLALKIEVIAVIVVSVVTVVTVMTFVTTVTVLTAVTTMKKEFCRGSSCSSNIIASSDRSDN